MLTETQVPANGVPAGALDQVTDENASLLAITDIQPGQSCSLPRSATPPKASS